MYPGKFCFCTRTLALFSSSYLRRGVLGNGGGKVWGVDGWGGVEEEERAGRAALPPALASDDITPPRAVIAQDGTLTDAVDLSHDRIAHRVTAGSTM